MNGNKGDARRATSAGYRLPDRPSGPLASQSSVSVFRHSTARIRNPEKRLVESSDARDPVKQDQVWREFVRTERSGVQEWEKNWSFLLEFDQLGRPRTEASLPDSVSLFSDRFPNTTNQMFGSGIYSELGKKLICLDNLLLLTSNHRKTKMNQDMQPY